MHVLYDHRVEGASIVGASGGLPIRSVLLHVKSSSGIKKRSHEIVEVCSLSVTSASDDSSSCTMSSDLVALSRSTADAACRSVQGIARTYPLHHWALHIALCRRSDT
jgi:hypothetical protein